MKKTLLLMLAVALLILPGCASTGASSTVAESDAYCAKVDCAKMHQVSRDARRNGHVVIWVNPLQKTAAKTAVAPGAAVN
ncbi:MAG: hypothetical protein HYV18_07435 [Gammaproteobacteria bacterium]|nr:hypothetical protein [Gammaproteobacteria bacterium]